MGCHFVHVIRTKKNLQHAIRTAMPHGCFYAFYIEIEQKLSQSWVTVFLLKYLKKSARCFELIKSKVFYAEV